MPNNNHARIATLPAASNLIPRGALPTAPGADRITASRDRVLPVARASRLTGPWWAVAVGAALALLTWPLLASLPSEVAMDGLAAFVGTGSLLFLGIAALSSRLSTCAGNLAACGAIFAWAVLAPVTAGTLALGLFAHATAWGLNAWQAGRTVDVGRELALAMTASTFVLAPVALAIGF